MVFKNATIAEGVPQMLEHNDIRWITPGEIPQYEFCPADEEILAKICSGYSDVNYNLSVSVSGVESV